METEENEDKSWTVTESLPLNGLIEIGNEATWLVSSAKPGNGVEKLRDNLLDTFWQSDGNHPHHISIQFPSRVTIRSVSLYLSMQHDDSYTPQNFTVRAGSCMADLAFVTKVEVSEPTGWLNINLETHSLDNDVDCLKCHILTISVTKMHQNGRDAHIRQVKVHSPSRCFNGVNGMEAGLSREFRNFLLVR